MREFVVAGLLVAPFVKYALIEALVFVPARLILVVLKFEKWFWHPLLAEAAIYVCILATLNIVV